MDLATCDPGTFRDAVEPYRRELLAHCYRMCGSLCEAEDLVQDTFLRAWQARSGFEGRSSVRRWLHSIATHAALDALRQRKRRTLPRHEGPPSDPAIPLPPPLGEPVWLEPYPEALLPDDAPGPEARTSARESVELAFLAAVHRLTPQQRAVLLLRDVLGYAAQEVAEVLDLTVAAVNGTLLRARATLPDAAGAVAGEPDEALVRRYVDAWERRDLGALVALLREDAVLSMPPIPAWYHGPDAIARVLGTSVLAPGPDLVFTRIRLNGGPGLAGWIRPDPAAAFAPLGVQAFSVRDGRVREITCFVGPAWHRFFGLPDSP